MCFLEKLNNFFGFLISSSLYKGLNLFLLFFNRYVPSDWNTEFFSKMPSNKLAERCRYYVPTIFVKAKITDNFTKNCSICFNSMELQTN